MTHVAILFGGTSSERLVSIRSAQSVKTALLKNGYTVTLFDTADISGDDLAQAMAGCDVVFPVLHGVGGEDGQMQAWMEHNNFVYVGADSPSSALCFDKSRYKQRLTQLGIGVPSGEMVTAETFWKSSLIKRPYVLKPNDGGSSVDTFIIRDPLKADEARINAALIEHTGMLLEELIDGQEITVGTLCGRTLPVIEIIPPADGEFDYENKYNGKTLELCPPENVPQRLQQKAQEIAMQINRELGVRDMSRTDMIINKSGGIYVLETNTIPGMTEQSLLPKAAAASGIAMTELVRLMVEAALNRKTAA